MVTTMFILDRTLNTSHILTANKNSQSAFWADTYTQEFDTGAESLEFSCYAHEGVKEGNYVAFFYNSQYKMFQITEIEEVHKNGRLVAECYCETASLQLLNNYVRPFSGDMNCIQFFEYILNGTEWRIGKYSNSLKDKVVTVNETGVESVWSLIEDYKDIFECEINTYVTYENGHVTGQFIDVFSEGGLGSATFKRFEYGKNVTGITKSKDLYDWCTGIIIDCDCDVTDTIIKESQGYGFTKGAGDVILDDNANRMYNAGRTHVIGVYEGDETEPVEACINAWKELQKRKAPKFDYKVTTALTDDEYEEVRLGDTVYVVDHSYTPPLLLEARVGKLELSFTNRSENTCTLTNYKEIKSKLLDANYIKLTGTITDIVNSFFPITNEGIADGAISDGKIDTVYYQQITADIVSAGIGAFENLYTQGLTVINADIEKLNADTADITQLKAQVADIDTLVNGHLTSDNIQSMVITGDKFTVADAFIKDAMIDTVNAGKINAGQLNTSLVSIGSEDGSLTLNGSLQQFKDSSGKVRIQIGKDAQGNFTFCLFSQDGQGVLIDETGIKEGAIGDGLIVDNMVAEDANIDGGKLDISSVITQINNNSTLIKSSKIFLDEQNQSLEVAFDALKTKVETIENITVDGDLSSIIEQVSSNTTNINVMQGEISSLISNTTITKSNGQVVQLKDEYNATKNTVDSHSTKIGSLETTVNGVSSKQSTFEQDLGKINLKISDVETNSVRNFNNLIINSNLKNSKDTWYSNNIGKVGVTTTSSSKIDDNHSVRIDCNESAVYLNSNRIRVNPGETYTIGVWGLCAEYNDYLRFYSLFCDNATNDNNYLSSPILLTFRRADDSGWQYKTATFTIPEGTTYLSIKARGQSTQSTAEFDGRCWFSCLMLVRGDTVASWTDNSNDNYAEFARRMSSAELKITDDAIVSTVSKSNSFATKDDVKEIENSYVTKTEFNQTSDDFTFKIQQAGGYNLIKNSTADGGLNGWACNTDGNTYFLTTLKSTNSKATPNGNAFAYINLSTTTERYSYSPRFPLRPNTTYTFSAWIQTQANVSSLDIFILGSESLKGDDSDNTTYDSKHIYHPVNGYNTGGNWQYVTKTFTTKDGIKSAYVRVDHNGLKTSTDSYVYIYWASLMLTEGDIALPWSPHPSEIYDGIVKIDKGGLSVQHGNNKSVLNGTALNFYEGSTLYSRVDGGVFKFMNPSNTSNAVGSVGRFMWNGSSNFCSCLAGGPGHSTAMGTVRQSGGSTICNIVDTSQAGYVSGDSLYLEQGLNIMTANCLTLHFKANKAQPSPKESSVDVLSIWGASGTSSAGYPANAGMVYGRDAIMFGVAYGALKTAMEICESPNASNNTEVHMYSPLYMHRYPIYNSQNNSTLSARSSYSKALIENGSNEYIAYGGYSYDEGEVRWCWKEPVFTYAEADVDPVTDEWVYTGRNICYIELPIFLAENIEADYHIAIGKIGWGDYRILEKNQYYFILESQEEDFAFTFEIVAKLVDGETLGPNASISSMSTTANSAIPTEGPSEDDGFVLPGTEDIWDTEIIEVEEEVREYIPPQIEEDIIQENINTGEE